MTLTGNRGVNLHLECADAFALLSRLKGHVRPIVVLGEAETLWKFPGFVSLLISLCAICSRNPWWLLAVIPSSKVAAFLLIDCKWGVSKFFLPLKKLAGLYSLVTGYGIFVVLCLCLSYLMLGWAGTIGYLICNLLRMMIDSKLQMLSMLKAIKKQDESALLGMLEIKCFLLAYERYARKYGVNSSSAITRTELTAGVDLLDEFVREWPMIAKRFGDGKGVELPLKDL